MCRIRSNRCRNRNRNDSVLGESGIQRIALRGPGCISGTGQCEGVLGTGGGICCGEVLGTGGRRCAEVLGTGGRRCDNVLGTGGRRRQDNCECSWDDLTTPTTVPR